MLAVINNLSAAGRKTFTDGYNANFALNPNATVAQAHKALGPKFTSALTDALRHQTIDKAFNVALAAALAKPSSDKKSFRKGARYNRRALVTKL